MDPAAGAEGDPAGAAAYDGVFESEPVAGRPVLVLDERARRTTIVRPSWTGELRTRTSTLTLDGYNRVPGLIRNCGGDATDRPTSLPLHDVTCTAPDELVAFTPAFGATTPQGAGTEVVIGRRGHAGGAAGRVAGARRRAADRARPRSPLAAATRHLRHQRRAAADARRSHPHHPEGRRGEPDHQPELRLRLGAAAQPAHLRGCGRRRAHDAGHGGRRWCSTAPSSRTPPTPPGSVRWATRSTCADRRVSLRGTDRAGDGRGPSRGSHLGSSSVA